MNYWTLLIIGFITSLSSLAAYPQECNRWNVYAGGSISHNCKRFKWLLDESTGFNWGGGALIGAGYQIGLAQRWSLTPALELSFNDNGAYLNKSGKPLNPDWGGQLNMDTWASYWAIHIPVTVGYRISLSNDIALKIDGGVFLSEAFSVTTYRPIEGTTDATLCKKVSSKGIFDKNFQTGVLGGLSLETGRHFSYFFRTDYPLLTDRVTTRVITLSLGVKYTF